MERPSVLRLRPEREGRTRKAALKVCGERPFLYF